MLETTRTSHIKIYTILIAGTAASSLSAVFVNIAMNGNVNPAKIAFWRFFLISILQWIVLFLRPSDRALIKQLTVKQVKVSALSGLFLGLHFAIYYLSFQYISTLTSTLLVCIQPFFVSIGAFLLFREAPVRRSWFGIFAAVSGVMLIAASSGFAFSSSLKGNVMALISALLAPGYLLCGRYIMRKQKDLPVLLYTSCVYISAFLVIGIAMALAKENVFNISFLGLAMSALVCVISQGLGHFAANWGLKHAKASHVSSIFLLEPVFLFFWNLIIWNKMPLSIEILGGILILSGIFYFIRCEGKKTETA